MRLCGHCENRVWDEEAIFCPLDGHPLEPTAPGGDPLIGTTLCDQFEVTELVGTGATGRIYRAWQRGTDREVAVKVLRDDLADQHGLRIRFVREARAAARLSHPNIVTVHMVGETDDGLPYLVMELVAGSTLEEVSREGPLAPARAIAIAQQIASALVDAHASGVVHRDLKPDNVVLTWRGAVEHVTLLDFGVAKLAGRISDVEETVEVTRDGLIFGTPHYLAPEQACGARVDGRADLYSLGIILYRILSGRLPFDGNGAAVVLAQIHREPAPIASLVPDLDPRLAALVMRCLAKDPSQRFATAEELAAALAALTWTEPPAPPRRRAGRLLAAALAVLCAGAIAGAATAVVVRGALTPTPSVGTIE